MGNRLVKATERALAAENRRALADPNLEADLARDLALWQAAEDSGEVPMTSRENDEADNLSENRWRIGSTDLGPFAFGNEGPPPDYIEEEEEQTLDEFLLEGFRRLGAADDAADHT